jgi:uncharacterized protein YeeX (DUF496 family)
MIPIDSKSKNALIKKLRDNVKRVRLLVKKNEISYVQEGKNYLATAKKALDILNSDYSMNYIQTISLTKLYSDTKQEFESFISKLNKIESNK